MAISERCISRYWLPPCADILLVQVLLLPCAGASIINHFVRPVQLQGWQNAEKVINGLPIGHQNRARVNISAVRALVLVCGCPAISSHVRSLKPVLSTTRVSPSQCPTE